jgi:anti-anti-sigma factor
VNHHASFNIAQKNDICIVRIAGRLATGADDDYMRAKASEIKNLSCSKLVIDVSGLDSTGSTGLGFFVDLYAWITRRTPGGFILAGPSPRVLEVLQLTGIAALFQITPDLDAAVAVLARAADHARTAGTSPG